MKKLIASVLVVFALSPFAPAEESLAKRAQDGWAALSKTYQSAMKSGRPAAERLVKQAPKHFRSIVKTAGPIMQQIREASNPADLEQKKELLLELWRIRGGLDVLALLSPETLQMVTGVDFKELNLLRTKVAKTLSEYGTAKKPAKG